jgi:chromate transporter
MKTEDSRSETTGGVSQRVSLGDLALLFLRLGTIGFGGPAAHIAMMEDEVVRRRRWLSREEFLDLLGATNLIPGPNSTEMAIHIGHRRAGWIGLLIAGSCFILPAALIVMGFAWAYVRYGTMPQAGALLYGVKPVIIAIVLQALWGFTREALKTRLLVMIGAAGMLSGFWGINELAILLGAGVVAGIGNQLRNRMNNLLSRGAPFILIMQAAAAGVSGAAAVGLWPLFLFFLKVGSILYGSGYVLLAFLRADLVERWHWLSEAQLLDAIAVGQVTPGPVFTTATFIGYLLGGFDGAIVATIGIFLPAFFFVALSGPLVPRIRASATAGAFLDGVNAASLALMAVVTWQLANAAVIDLATVALLVISLILLVRYRLNSVWLVIGGGAIGLLTHLRW